MNEKKTNERESEKYVFTRVGRSYAFFITIPRLKLKKKLLQSKFIVIKQKGKIKCTKMRIVDRFESRCEGRLFYRKSSEYFNLIVLPLTLTCPHQDISIAERLKDVNVSRCCTILSNKRNKECRKESHKTHTPSNDYRDGRIPCQLHEGTHAQTDQEITGRNHG